MMMMGTIRHYDLHHIRVPVVISLDVIMSSHINYYL